MRREIEPIGIAAERLGVAIDPADRAPHLLDHRKQAAARVVDVDEVEHDVMRAGVHERLGQERVVGGAVGAPGAAMDEDVDRRIRRARVR